MKCQILFYRKNKKNNIILSFAEFVRSMVSVKRHILREDNSKLILSPKRDLIQKKKKKFSLEFTIFIL